MLVGKLNDLGRRVERLESIERIESEMNEQRAKIRDLKSKLNTLRERNSTLEKELRDMISTIDNLECRKRMQEMRDGMARQEAIHKDNPNGNLLWKIEGYQKKRQDAISGVKTVLYSPPFYSDQHGYKMCAKLYLNGEGAGKGTHLSLFFVLMKGE